MPGAPTVPSAGPPNEPGGPPGRYPTGDRPAPDRANHDRVGHLTEMAVLVDELSFNGVATSPVVLALTGDAFGFSGGG